MEARVSRFDVASANFRQSQAARRYSSTVPMGLPLVSPIPEVGATKKRFFPFPLHGKNFNRPWNNLAEAYLERHAGTKSPVREVLDPGAKGGR